METHQQARLEHACWPGRDVLQKATKGRYGLHSQSVQMIVRASQAEQSPGTIQATVDLGEIHLAAVKNRNWACRACGFTGHRDLVGSVNMHHLAFGTHPQFPRCFTYLRPGVSRSRSSRADTPPCCLSQSAAQARLAEPLSSETAYTTDDAQKPISL
ncbi:MAG TPA: zinc ribbon domain-containing protein [Ktedonobacteraceae bacterium]|nr:zinc ribbon domain-containing protein [Ktedonobacteraceae bacterium]